VSYPTLVHARQVLARQQDHATAIERYLRAEGGIHDDTGLLLGLLAPPAWAALEIGARIAGVTGQLGAYAADQLGRTVESYVEADRNAYESQAALARRLGATMAAWSNPADGIPDVGPAAGGAPPGFGEPPTWFTAQVAVEMAIGGALVNGPGQAVAAGRGIADAVSPSVDQLVRSGGDLVDEVGAWTGPAGAVQETTDPQTYLVTPDLGINEFQELRWSAGAVLSGLDWLAEQLIGFSILEEVVFKPFAGDAHDIKRAAMAWSNTGQAFTAIAENFAGLTSSTMDGWKGSAGDAFRGAMAAGSAAFVGVSRAATTVSDLVQKIALVSQLACTGIGMALKKISEKLISLAAKAAVPVAGWALAAGEAITLIQDVIGYVRLAYVIIEGVVDVIDGFVGGYQSLVQSLGVIEDLAEFAFRAARA
jgi:roadblock/LC7 domain-containing protein